MSDNNVKDKTNEVVKTSSRLSTRRQTLKTLTIGSAVAGAVWTKPVIDSIVLPAHAETTDSGSGSGDITPDPCTVNCNLGIHMSWGANTANPHQDIFLEVHTPGGTIISPNGAQRGQCLELKNHGNISDAVGSATISNITAGKVAPGRYQLFTKMENGAGAVNMVMSASSDCDGSDYASVRTSDQGTVLNGSINVSAGGTVVIRVE